MLGSSNAKSVLAVGSKSKPLAASDVRAIQGVVDDTLIFVERLVEVPLPLEPLSFFQPVLVASHINAVKMGCDSLDEFRSGVWHGLDWTS